MHRPDPNICGFLGYWASGKSYLMIREAVKRLLRNPNTIVGHNCGFQAHPHLVEVNTLDEVIDFASWDTPGWQKLLMVDEVQSLARARSAAIFPPAADVVFTQGRKLQLSLLWTSQHWRFVDVNIRRVTDRVYQCAGMFHKRISERGELPERWRPRVFRARRFNAPDPEATTLPKKADSTHFVRWNQEVADSYDTMALVKNMALLMRQQNADLKNSPIVQLLMEYPALGSGAVDLSASRASR